MELKWTFKRIAAIVGIVLLVLMYLVMLISAIFGGPVNEIFRACVIATFAVPILIWVLIWLVGRVTGNKSMADLNIGGDDHIDNIEEELEKITK